MVSYSIEGLGEISHPTNASEFTVSDYCDIRKHLTCYDQCIKDDEDLEANDELLAALRICVTGEFELLPLFAENGHLSLNLLLEGIAKAIVTMPEQDPKGIDDNGDVIYPDAPTVLEWSAKDGTRFSFDTTKYEKLGGSLEQFVEFALLESCMPTDPFTASTTTNAFFGLTLKQCAVLFQSEALPLPVTGNAESRDKWLEEVAPMLADMPAHLAMAARVSAINFMVAYRKMIGKNTRSSNNSSTAQASLQGTAKLNKANTTDTGRPSVAL